MQKTSPSVKRDEFCATKNRPKHPAIFVETWKFS